MALTPNLEVQDKAVLRAKGSKVAVAREVVQFQQGKEVSETKDKAPLAKAVN